MVLPKCSDCNDMIGTASDGEYPNITDDGGYKRTPYDKYVVTEQTTGCLQIVASAVKKPSPVCNYVFDPGTFTPKQANLFLTTEPLTSASCSALVALPCLMVYCRLMI